MPTGSENCETIQRLVRVFDLSKCYQTITLVGKDLTLTPQFGPLIWKDMRRNSWTDTVKRQTRKATNVTTSLRHVWMIINVKKMNRKQLETCRKSAQTSSQNVFFIGRPRHFKVWKFLRSHRIQKEDSFQHALKLRRCESQLNSTENDLMHI